MRERLALDREHRMLFITIEGLAVRSPSDIRDIEQQLTALQEPPGSHVAVVETPGVWS